MAKQVITLTQGSFGNWFIKINNQVVAGFYEKEAAQFMIDNYYNKSHDETKT